MDVRAPSIVGFQVHAASIAQHTDFAQASLRRPDLVSCRAIRVPAWTTESVGAQKSRRPVIHVSLRWQKRCVERIWPTPRPESFPEGEARSQSSAPGAKLSSAAADANSASGMTGARAGQSHDPISRESVRESLFALRPIVDGMASAGVTHSTNIDTEYPVHGDPSQGIQCYPSTCSTPRPCLAKSSAHILPCFIELA
jgi:hypothetical protein